MRDQQSLRSACACGQSDQIPCWSLENSMIVRLLTELHLEFLSLKGGCKGSSESTVFKMPHCWKSHVTAHMSFRHTSSGNMLLSMLFSCYCKLRVLSDLLNQAFLPLYLCRYSHRNSATVHIAHITCHLHKKCIQDLNSMKGRS